MLKIISGMPAKVQDRFKVLHMLSDERSQINDEFDKKVKALEIKFAERKKPLLELRNKIVSGEITDFSEFVPKFDAAVPELETIVAGIVKLDDKENEEEEKPHVPTDVTHLKDKVGIPDFWAKAI
jgi:malate synthase